MRKLFIMLIFTIVVLLTPMRLKSQNSSINFKHKPLNEIIEQAKIENKIILIDVFTEWCGPCKEMSKNIFTNKQVADFYNKNFICLKIDAEKGNGSFVSRKYNVNCFPTFLFLCPNGDLKNKATGSKTVEEFIEIGKNALNPEINLASLNQQYEDGNRDSTFLVTYIGELYSAGLPCEDIIDVFFKPKKNLFSPQCWAVINKYINNEDSKYYKFLFNNQEKFEALYGDEVSKKLNNRSIFNFITNNFGTTILLLIIATMIIIGLIKSFYWLYLFFKWAVIKFKKRKPLIVS